MENGKDDNVVVLYDANQLIEAVSEELATLYFENTDDDGDTSNEGFLQMQEVIDAVPEGLRAPVFASFLTKLQEAGVEYDTEEFQPRYH